MEKIGWFVYVAMIAFLAFVGGAMLVVSETYPYSVFRDAWRAGTALLEQRRDTLDPFSTDQWMEPRTEETGVTVHDETRAAPGYTLYTSGDGPHARLISMDGELLHEWRLPFSEIWTPEAAVDDPQPDDLTYMRKAELLPNGDLIAIYEAAGDSPWGYGMVRLDRDSRPIWSYLEHTHHDFDLAPDGRIYALTHEFTDQRGRDRNQLDMPYLDDFLVILSPDGEEERKISLIGAMEDSRYNAFLHAIPFFSLADPLHTNTVEYITAEMAADLPFAGEGDVLLSFRDSGALAVLDVEAEKIVWATRGSWVGQHDPSVMENGDILLFDNLGAFRKNDASRVIQFDPETMEISWAYGDGEEETLHSAIRSAAERLPNGNTLITESDGGRLVEVSPEGDIVWEYVNPVREQREKDGKTFIPVVSWGQRINPTSLNVDFRDFLESHMEIPR